MKHFAFWLALLGAFALAAPQPASAQLGIGAEKSASKAGFMLPAEGPLRIVVFRPDVSVGSQTTAGLDEPNADWTAQARNLFAAELERQLAAKTAALHGDLRSAENLLFRPRYRAVSGLMVGTIRILK